MLDQKASKDEVSFFRSLAGELVWLGCGALPQALLVGSEMQQLVPFLKVSEIAEYSRAIRQLENLSPIVTFRGPRSKITDASIVTFSDASFNIRSGMSYGQSGFVSGILYRTADGDDKTFHPLDCGSSKQRRVTHSSYGAEVLACCNADDYGLNLKMAFRSVFENHDFPHVLVADSKGLFDTITTLHDGLEYRLRQTGQRIRDSFESHDIDVLRWVQGPAKIADAMTKRSTHSHRLLNRVMSTGILSLPQHKHFELESENWQ